MGETLLDLSDWPASPQRTGLPPRPSPGRRPWLPLTAARVALASLGLGALLLLIPTGGCGPALGAWAARPLALPPEVAPELDDAETRADADAVAHAQTALAAWHPAVRSTTASSSSTRTVGAVDPREVEADEDALGAAQADATAAQRGLDDLLAQQEASDDPGQYDGQVAAAREDLDRAVATVEEARRALAAARARTRTITVTTTAPPVPAASPAARTALVAQLTEARQVQAAHLASRAQVVADWRAGHEQLVLRVSAHNAHVTSCAKRAAAPAATGTGSVVLGGGMLLRRRLRSLRRPR